MGLGLVVLLIAVVGAIFALGDRYDFGPLAAGHLIPTGDDDDSVTGTQHSGVLIH
jgi:hypothetical protein